VSQLYNFTDRILELNKNVKKNQKQGVALMGRNMTGPPCSVGCPTAHTPGCRRADRPRAWRPTGPPAGSVTEDDRRRQQTTASKTKQYWPIRRASNNKTSIN